MDCASESQSCVQLDYSGSPGAQETAEEWIGDVGPEPGKVRMIERVQHVHTDLQLGGFPDREIFR